MKAITSWILSNEVFNWQPRWILLHCKFFTDVVQVFGYCWCPVWPHLTEIASPISHHSSDELLLEAGSGPQMLNDEELEDLQKAWFVWCWWQCYSMTWLLAFTWCTCWCGPQQQRDKRWSFHSCKFSLTDSTKIDSLIGLHCSHGW